MEANSRGCRAKATGKSGGGSGRCVERGFVPSPGGDDQGPSDEPAELIKYLILNYKVHVARDVQDIPSSWAQRKKRVRSPAAAAPRIVTSLVPSACIGKRGK
jgi:hypothetical protein